MSDEVSIDIFGEGNLVELDEPDMVLGLEQTPETEPRRDPGDLVIGPALTLGPTEAGVAEAPGASRPLELPYAMIFRSKGEGPDHVVLQQADGNLICNCWPGTRRTGHGCHAMAAGRAILGMPEPDEGPPA